MGEFRMPSLGADMDRGAVVEWRVAPGDVVHRGDVVAVVDTDKADIEVEVFEDGVVEELLVDVGAEVAVGTPLARLASLPAAAPDGATDRRARGGPAATAPAAPPPAPGIRASPRARRPAAERGVDLATITPTGRSGAITAGDVLAASTPSTTAAAPAAPPAQPTIEPSTERPSVERRPADRSASLRRAIGELMARSAREIPHYYVASTIDLDPTMTWLTAENEPRPPATRILPIAALLTATARALTTCPVLNGWWRDGAFRPADRVNLGVAVALRGGGLVAPAILDADQLGVEAMMRSVRDLVERARTGNLRASEMADGSVTVTNLGDRGAEEVLGVIYVPQVALIGMGRIVERPWVVGGLLGVRPTVRMTVAADHRVSDGNDASRLLSTIEHLLARPEDLR